MRARMGLSAIAGLMLLGAAAPGLPVPTTEEIRKFAAGTTPDWSAPRGEPFMAWEADLKRALATATPDQAADQLAEKYGLSRPLMRQLVDLWLTAAIKRWDITFKPALAARLRDQLLAMVPASHRSPLVIEVAAAGLDYAYENCHARDFDALMAGSTDRVGDAWMVSRVLDCEELFLRFVRMAPDRATPALLRLALRGSLGARDKLPLLAWLTGPEGSARIAEADRPALLGRLNREYLGALFYTGQRDKALARFESLPPDIRDRVIDTSRPVLTASIDGLPYTLRGEDTDDSLIAELSAAYAVAGRTAEAEALFARLTSLPQARQLLDCEYRYAARIRVGPIPAECLRPDRNVRLNVLALDLLLHHPGDDPYPLAEVMFGASAGSSGGQSAMAEVMCRVFSAPEFRDNCRWARAAVSDAVALVPNAGDATDDALAVAAIEAAHIPGMAEARAATRAEFQRIAATIDDPRNAANWHPEAVTPAPVPYAQLPLPDRFRGTRGSVPAWPSGFAPLPDGYLPVRIGRDGQRAVAISVSQNYDPTGEISQGGYWVHLSDDGGKTWRAPLYTGLAQNFPYVVPAASRMPLIDGDTLNVEVEVAELDTSSITYPPVGLRTRRREANLYLKLPLAELERDSDRDGLTDVAARHLLLDTPAAPGSTPFVVGTSPAAECTAPAPAERRALVAILERIFSIHNLALVEPVDRPASGPLGNWRGAATSWDRPILVTGDPRDYACLNPDRLMIVYGEADLLRLRRMTPDFNPVAMPRIVFNRAHDRGYVKWSMGWVGGTYRLRLVDGEWVIEEITQWIT